MKMASLMLLLVQLLLMVSNASGSSNDFRHFAGSATFTPKRINPDGTWEWEIRVKQTSVYCYYNAYLCYGNCGSQTQINKTSIFGNSYGWSRCEYEVVTRRKTNGNRPFQIRYPSTLSTGHGQGYWYPNVRHSRYPVRMMAYVDLGTRSDTGEPNRAPIATTFPTLRIPRNCPRLYSMTLFDPDGDQVRCRIPTDRSTYECNFCSLNSGFSLTSPCTLEYNGQRVSSGHYPFELLVEDFPKVYITLSYNDGSYTSKRPLTPERHTRDVADTTTAPATTTALYRTTIPPLSKLPIQFNVYVDSHNAPSCTDGEYFPIFLSPTPRNGVNLPASVNHTLNIRVRSSARYTTIVDLVLTGPGGISRQRISTEEFLVKWTPSENELDDHFPICFVVEAKDSSNRVYQSEMRCVIVDVGHYDIQVTCNETAMTVEVEKNYLIRRNEDNLHLDATSGASCNLTRLSNETHLVAVMSLSSCGTRVEEDQNNIIFRNSITSADPTSVISRKNDVDIAILCAYPKRINLTLGFKHKNPYAFSEKAFGAFSLQFEFYDSQRFTTQIDPNSYPVDVYLKQMMFMQIEATTSIPNTQLFVESCRATPQDNPNSHVGYTIIQNGCVMDDTVQIYTGSQYQFRFGMEAFEFIGAYDDVYITCSVILCETNIPGSRCSQGCIRSDSQRSRREAGAQTGSHLISQGPLRLKMPASPVSGLNLNLGMNLALVAFCLLLCGAVIYKYKWSNAKYHRLPTSDTD